MLDLWSTSLMMDATEGQEPRYGQSHSHVEKQIQSNPCGARTVVTVPRGEQLSIVTSPPKTVVQQPSPFVVRDRERQRQVAFDQSEPQYKYEDQD